MKCHLILPCPLTNESLKPGQGSRLPKAAQTGAVTWHGPQPSWNAREHWTHACRAEFYWLRPSGGYTYFKRRVWRWHRLWYHFLLAFSSLRGHAWVLFLSRPPLFFTHSSVWYASLMKRLSFLLKVKFCCPFPGYICFSGEKLWITRLIGTFWKMRSS